MTRQEGLKLAVHLTYVFGYYVSFYFTLTVFLNLSNIISLLQGVKFKDSEISREKNVHYVSQNFNLL